VEAGQPLVEIERELLESRVREAQAALLEARVKRRYARLDLDRARELERSGAVSNQQGDSARARSEVADAAVARAQAFVERLSTELGYATVRASMAGRVLDVYVEEGGAVSPVTSVTGGTILLSLAATDILHLEGLVDENEIARVSEGQEARVRTEAFGDRIFLGRVRDIAPVGQRIQNVTYFEVEIEVIDPEAALLRPRMSGDGEIVTEVVKNALVIPETALRYRGGDILVQVVNGDGSLERVVTIGIVDGDRVQVLTGIEEGEEVRLQ
jgi:RND family efflux transporter MFP subunit